MKIIKPSKEDVLIIRNIAKSFGVKGCKVVNFYCLVGNQVNFVDSKVAHEFMNKLKESGYFIDHEAVCRELADKGLSSNWLIAKVV